MPSHQWINENRRGQIGQLIKKMIKNSSDEHLGYWYEELKAARKVLLLMVNFQKMEYFGLID